MDPAEELSAGPTRDRLWRRAVAYLQRYVTSSGHLRRVLLRRALREAAAAGLDPAPLRDDIDAVVDRLVQLGLIDDAAFAEARARRLRERGASRRQVVARLGDQGIDVQGADAALARLAEAQPNADLRAAMAFARRRRLGPWRDPTVRAERRERDAAALGRAGFSWRLARQVVEAPSVEALEAALES